MKTDRIMDALGKVKEDYIMESAPGKKKINKTHIRWIAASIAAVMLFLFCQSAPGAAALEIVKEAITNVIENLFPPKDIEMSIEGFTEIVNHEPIVQEPETQGNETVTSGFVIYYDAERYEMVEENGATYIRHIAVLPSHEEIRNNSKALFKGLTEEEAEAKIDELLAQLEAFYTSLPPCEIEIIHLPNVQPFDAAQVAHTEATAAWDNVTEVSESEQPAGYYFHAYTGEVNWDSPHEWVYFTSDGRNGTFQISERYYVEAAGHGIRFAAMLRTFEVINP